MVRLCDLPKEIIEKIMLGAPADSVFQFKFANKFWYSLISDFINNPEFVSKHLLIAKNHSSTSLLFNSRSPHADQRLITFPLLSINHDDGKNNRFITSTEAVSVPLIISKPPIRNYDNYDFYDSDFGYDDHLITSSLISKPFSAISYDDYDDYYDYDDHFMTSPEAFSVPPRTYDDDDDDYSDFDEDFISREARYKDMSQWSEVCSCDGLILLVNKLGTMMLCNPALKEHTILPKPKNAKIKSPSPGIGFGLDPVTNEYKCVAIWCHYEGLKVEVYTLGSDSWREINMPEDKMDDIIDDMMFDEELYNGLCCRGVYYWLVKNPSSCQDDNMIFSFNLSNEELQLLHVPDLETLGIDRRYWLHLSVWNDSVMMCLTTRSLIIHIFRMDEVEDGSWTKYAVKVGPMHNHQNVLPYWKNDEILMSIWKRDDMPNVKLVYYNIFTQEMRDVCDMDRSILDSPVCSYVKSLVSIRR
ncbi:uncharacterized protein LOC133037707 [Cannabis sativa]|uniref:uncharacterized protein LOC133037707 n=1 Tax=Cannabis sativa TaxID=3483 RepID=UPI0029CA6EA6|nr:uncharacterized protein LOC133037707 [Cannabis sativa]